MERGSSEAALLEEIDLLRPLGSLVLEAPKGA